jgi:glutamate-1-semialdehyde 2,1-aminomutase
LFDLLEYGKGEPPRVMHQGTYNAGPISAAAGIATLEQVRDSDAISRANQAAAALREGLSAEVRRKGLDWCVYGCFSEFHIHAGGPTPPEKKGTVPAELAQKIRLGMLVHGVDLPGWPGGMTSAAHSTDDVERTVEAFRATLDALGDEGAL